MYKAEIENLTMYNFVNVTISTFRSMYKAEIENLTMYNFVNVTRSTFRSITKLKGNALIGYFNEINTNCDS